MLTVLFTGLLTSLALIVAIGPQSAWLLRQGLRKDRVLIAAVCCLIGDATLIALGTLGVGTVIDHAPWLLEGIRWVGVAYLLWFAYRSARSAFAHSRTSQSTVEVTMTSELDLDPDEVRALSQGRAVDNGVGSPGGSEPAGSSASVATATATSARSAVKVTSVSKITTVATTGLTLSILNPHAWVDSLVVLGAMANSFGEDRWWFALGATLASVVWFSLLLGGSVMLSKVLNKPRTWQIIDAVVAIVMVTVAGLLAFNGF